MKQHCKEIANRQIDAANDFIVLLMESGKCSREQAEKVFNLYLKEKMIKLDTWMGRYSVKHGAYWDYQVIQNAIEA